MKHFFQLSKMHRKLVSYCGNDDDGDNGDDTDNFCLGITLVFNVQ